MEVLSLWPIIGALVAFMQDGGSAEVAATGESAQDPAPALDSLSTNPAEGVVTADGQAAHSGRFVYEILTGVEFSQDDGEFSEENFFLRFVGDTSWRTDSRDEKLSWFGDVHTSAAITLATIPVVETTTDMGMTTDEFITSKKAVSFAFGVESRTWKLGSTGDGQTLFVGPILRGGFSTLTEDAKDETMGTVTVEEDVDSVSSFYGGGIRIGEGPSIVPGVKEDEPFNSQLVRYVDIHYSRYENLDGNRVTFDALLRPKSGKGFFLGARALVGEGKDDVRIYAGISISAEAIENAITGLSGLISF